MAEILIVDDDQNINNLLYEALTREHYSCVQAYSGTEAMLVLGSRTPDLVILDLMIPGLSGEAVLAKLREQSDLPVIVLSAKDSLDSKVDVLSAGADDYVTKPFEIKEILARIHVQLRKKGKAAAGAERTSYRNLTMDRESFAVFVGDREAPKFTKQEFAILELLVQNPSRVFSKEAIFSYAWEEAYMGETKTLDVHISNIRKKLKTVSPEEYIETVWGIGYRIAREN